ncbi:C-X-C motif chemokine 9-like [Thunnus albacares]|uniref:C-X-C motif chemokine 9-like n=1 Tax=Thunnus albacares TaxID=8236 RepID=UPI001CF63C03|nr:C-X-C motif chemokine 9-like [Thunnus albacares]
MSCIIKVTLLLAVVVCISATQMDNDGEHCLCQRASKGFPKPSEIKDVQIYPVTIFCDKVEIVVTMNNGLRFCLNPKLKAVKRLMNNIIKQKSSTTNRPTEVTSTQVTATV